MIRGGRRRLRIEHRAGSGKSRWSFAGDRRVARLFLPATGNADACVARCGGRAGKRRAKPSTRPAPIGSACVERGRENPELVGTGLPNRTAKMQHGSASEVGSVKLLRLRRSETRGGFGFATDAIYVRRALRDFLREDGNAYNRRGRERRKSRHERTTRREGHRKFTDAAHLAGGVFAAFSAFIAAFFSAFFAASFSARFASFFSASFCSFSAWRCE